MFNLIYVGNYRPQTGGAAISCHQLMVEFARRGCRSRVLASVTGKAESETLAFDAANEEVEIRRFPVPFYFNEPYEPAPREWEDWSRAGVECGLERMIEDARPDALLLREGWIPFAAPVAARHGIPTIALIRGNPTAAILSGVFPRGPGEEFLLELSKMDLIVAVAQHFVSGLRRHGFEDVRSIRNGIDLRAFFPRPRDAALAARLDIADSDIVAIHAAQIKPLKRPMDIVHSAPEVLRGNPNVLYLIVGEGVSREEMKAASREAGVIGRFRFEPFVDYERMPRYMNLADMVIMPSEREGLARVYLEAQACGKTLIASEIPASCEVVSQMETGLLFRKGDIADLVEKTLLAANDPDLRARIGVLAREYVRRHSIETVVDEFLEAIGEVVKPSRRSDSAQRSRQ